MDCGNIQSITIPSGVVSFGENAFINGRYKTVYAMSTGLPMDLPFSDEIKQSAILYVPVGMRVKYQNTDWSDIREIGPDGIEMVDAQSQNLFRVENDNIVFLSDAMSFTLYDFNGTMIKKGNTSKENSIKKYNKPVILVINNKGYKVL